MGGDGSDARRLLRRRRTPERRGGGCGHARRRSQRERIRRHRALLLGTRARGVRRNGPRVRRGQDRQLAGRRRLPRRIHLDARRARRDRPRPRTAPRGDETQRTRSTRTGSRSRQSSQRRACCSETPRSRPRCTSGSRRTRVGLSPPGARPAASERSTERWAAWPACSAARAMRCATSRTRSGSTTPSAALSGGHARSGTYPSSSATGPLVG